MTRISVPGGVLAELFAACALATVLTACTADSSQQVPRPPAAIQHADTYPGLLPDGCDDLISPLTVAQLLRQSQPGQRSYSYFAPDPRRDALRAMTCQHGITREGPKLVVSAAEYAHGRVARSHYTEIGGRGPKSEGVRVLSRPGLLRSSSTSSFLVILDRTRVLEFTLRLGAKGPDRLRSDLLSLARSVVNGLSEGGR